MSVEIHALPNGLRVAVEPMPGLRSAAVGVFVTAGGRHERLEQNGIAHFLEHMAFKGTPTRLKQDSPQQNQPSSNLLRLRPSTGSRAASLPAA